MSEAHIPLEEFEKHLPPKICKRGEAYYEQDRVGPFTQKSSLQNCTEVWGTQAYEVCLWIEEEELVQWSCNCPYDHGNLCKHVAAALFQWCYGEEEGRGRPGNMERVSNDKVAAQLLEQLTVKELRNYLRQCLQENPLWRDHFTATFSHRMTFDSVDALQKSLHKKIDQEADGAYGFMDQDSGQRVLDHAENITDHARGHLEQGRYQLAFQIAAMVRKEINSTALYADDGYDFILAIEFIDSLLIKIAGAAVSEPDRSYVFEGLLGIVRYASNDYRPRQDDNFLRAAARLARTEPEVRMVFIMLDAHFEGRDERLRRDLIRQFEGEEAARRFMQSRIAHDPDFRIELLQFAVEENRLEEARQLAQEGLEQVGEPNVKEASTWYEWLLKIAEIEEDQPAVIKYVRMLLLQPNARDPEALLKKLEAWTPDEAWPQTVEELYQTLANRRYKSVDKIALLCCHEGWWRRLAELLEPESLLTLDTYAGKLLPHHPDDLFRMYEDKLLDLVTLARGRREYQQVAYYLMRMKHLGAYERVAMLKEEMLKAFARRPALHEELRKV